MCDRGIGFVSFYNLSFAFWNCSDSVVFFFHFYYRSSWYTI